MSIFSWLFCDQEVERKARRQFKGLFDKSPGEIAHAGGEDDQSDRALDKAQKEDEPVDSESDKSEESHEGVTEAPREGWFSALWPTQSRLFSAIGLQKCNIL